MGGMPGSRAEPAIVVGAGVIGLSVAYELARRGRGVVVLERERPGAGASGAAGGMLAPISEADVEEPCLIDLACDSLERYPGFVTGLERLTAAGCGLEREGTLWVALDRDDLGELERLAAVLRDKGLVTEPVGAAGARALEPHLSHRVTGGLRAAGDHQVDPRRLLRALEAAVAMLGGTIRIGARVTEIRQRGGRVAGVSGTWRDGAGFTFDAPVVVLAAGAWSCDGIRSPLAAPRLRPVKGQLVRLRGPRLLTRVVRTPRVYLVPRDGGELLVGATMEETGYDATPTAGAVLDLLRHGREAVPGIYDSELCEVSVGLRSALDDHLPVIGQSELPGLFLAYGHFRNGVLLAPATAHHLADWLERGEAPAALRPFVPGRGSAAGVPALGRP